jgi:DNA-binding beta-propeller fold protein YncE
VFVDASGNLYVSDGFNQRIQKWAPGATTGTTVAGGNGDGSAANQFSYPSGLFVDASGNIYVSDWNNNRIQKWVK